MTCTSLRDYPELEQAIRGRVQQVLTDHITANPNIEPLRGTYRGTIRVTHYFDPTTELNVMMNTSGNLEGA